MASTGEYIDLHELAKGWKAAISRCSDGATKHESQIRNDRGNLPLHSATSFRAPIEVAGQSCCCSKMNCVKYFVPKARFGVVPDLYGIKIPLPFY